MPAKPNTTALWLALALAAALVPRAEAQLVFEGHSSHHHIRVEDRGDLRVLRFNNSEETRMSLSDPLRGHFEYTEYFHMPWLWNPQVERVLMLGLGGGSIQRAYLHHHPDVTIDTVELDPMVITVAREFFGVEESPRHRIHLGDGRAFLRRNPGAYDVILVDAYTTTRYGSSLPPHLATREFFALAASRLGTNGVLAYNVIGQMSGWQAELMGSIYRTMKTAFPQVYLFPAGDSMNVVLIGTRSDLALDYSQAQRLGGERVWRKQTMFPNFALRLRKLETNPPRRFADALVLTDDHAPIESLMRGAR